MRIQHLSKLGAAFACALSLSSQALEITDAERMVQDHSSDNINLMLGLNGSTQMQALKTIALDNGVNKVRYQQHYQGIPVYGYSVAATKTAMGSLTDLKGKFVNLDDKLVQTKPKLSADQVMQLILDNDKSLGKGASKAAKAKVYNKQNQLLIYIHNDQPILAYRVSYVVPNAKSETPSRPVYFVNAHNGQIIDAYENLQHVKLGEGPGGNAKHGCYEYGVDFDHLDITENGSNYVMNNANVKTVDLNHGTTGTNAYSFIAPRNDHQAINGACGPLNDAHYFGGVVFDMYNAYVGVPPLTFQLTMRVHYGSNYENAFWDGSSMTFGDGGSTFYPLVSLDVAAHEVSHGFTEQNSGLEYRDMSGGINEAFSDMAGEAAEYFMTGTNDFLVGEQIFKSAGALRYMENPPQDGRSIGHASDYTSGLDVHYSSGVFNKAFALLAQKPNWNTAKAFEVMALANQTYWNANSTFDEGACGVRYAAGDKGYNEFDVEDAFNSVGLYCGPVCLFCPPPILDKGYPIQLSGNTGEEQHYPYYTPADVKTATFTISGGSGDADLYVKFGSNPTTSNYDCRPYLAGNNENCHFAAAQAGTYYVMVKAYSAYSSVTLLGDHTTSTTTGDSGSVTDISVARDEMKFWTVDVPAGMSQLEVSINGGTGDADLYLKKGAAPTTTSYDCRPYKAGNSETCPVTNPAADTYHIGIRGYSAASGVTMNWSYE